MAKKLLFITACTAVFLFISCEREKFAAIRPAYLSVPEIDLRTAYGPEGSAHSEITTAWIIVNGQAAGAFELPCTVPVLAEGNIELEIYPGINMNGISSSRAIYTPYQKIEMPVELNAGDTLHLDQDSTLTTRYAQNASITVLEDFDRSGLNLSATAVSDTGIYKVSDSSVVFRWPGEDNGSAGEIILAGEKDFFEISSVETYNLPTSGRSVYLEMTYHNNIPFYVGIIANGPWGSEPVEVLYVYESEEWNKLYVNLVTELSFYASASSFQIFFGGFKPEGLDTGKIFLDNLKLVY